MHITGTRFDEPTTLKLLPNVEFAPAFHGAKDDNVVVHAGGV